MNCVLAIGASRLVLVLAFLWLERPVHSIIITLFKASDDTERQA